MTPVFQTIFSPPNGNCFQACVASIFDLPLSEVPNFFAGSTAEQHMTKEQWVAVREFAERHGTRATWIDPVPNSPDRQYVEALDFLGWPYVAIGPSPGGNWGHCIVRAAGKDVHDPNPVGRFLAGDPWLIILFEPSPNNGTPAVPETDA